MNRNGAIAVSQEEGRPGHRLLFTEVLILKGIFSAVANNNRNS
ncbi:hypothetical protein LMG33818_000755 [Halomonadaceae bacterium LMG 33818]